MPSKSESTWKLQVKDKFFGKFNVSFDEKWIDLIVEPIADGLFAPFLWAESKKDVSEISKMFAQLLLTIKPIYDEGKKNLPKYLGVHDKTKICFVEFYHFLPLFTLNDFDWTEKPSNVSKKTENSVANFLFPKEKIDNSPVIYEFCLASEEKELKKFIKENFTLTGDTVKLQITKNNFLHVYNRWEQDVRPTINAASGVLSRNSLIDGDFYLADLLSEDNFSVHPALKVRLSGKYFDILVKMNDEALFKQEITFTDKGAAHDKFWTKYQRPPAKEYWDYMLDRRELLVPQKVREQKGAYFTPQIWAEKAQEYLAKVFGDDWQDEYYIWDCCCGTGNLLVGLVNKDNIWASTLDEPDVNVVHELIKSGRNLWKSQVFQFDFLNDDFKPLSEGGKLPDELYGIIMSPEKQRKLIMFINPPYVEPRGETVGKANKKGYHISNFHTRCLPLIGNAAIEKFAQFLARMKYALPLSKIGTFGTLKYVNAPNFRKFRDYFTVEYKGGFIIPANTFDNVNGNFPIGFLIWDLEAQKGFQQIKTDVFDKDNKKLSFTKRFYKHDEKTQLINDWVRTFPQIKQPLATIIGPAADFQHQQNVWIIAPETDSNWFHWQIGEENLLPTAVYFAVRHVIPHTWINHNDQLLFPNDAYKRSKRFLHNCLTFALFHEKNKIKSAEGMNHWLPFKAREVKAAAKFESDFMVKFLRERKFGTAAQAVFNTGRALWAYYHQHNPPVNDASLYDIRAYFKGTKNGRVNAKSSDAKFTELDKALKDAMKTLADEIKPCLYEYGFLME
ncbi:MAG: hypothetical protein FWE67_08830 [Planctomycetaceae bacterium]|nr:hypothetical protein [Planctomycetaceae bacterium]